MRENQKRISLYLPLDLYTRCTQSGQSMTEAIISGLELVLNPKVENIEVSQELKEHIKVKDSQVEVKPEILELQEARIKELQEQIKVKDSQIEAKPEINEYQEARIKDLQEQIKVKDNQIERLTAAMQAQAVHVQTVLTQKSIEAPKTKKWYEFWK